MDSFNKTTPDHDETFSERTARLVSNPKFMEKLFKRMAEGASPIDLCSEWGMTYCDLMWLVQQDPERKAIYMAALIARSEWDYDPSKESFETML